MSAPGATPLDPDEAAGLLPSHITTQADLNTWEEANILQGERWALRQRKRDLLDEGFVRDLLDNTRYQIEHQVVVADEASHALFPEQPKLFLRHPVGI